MLNFTGSLRGFWEWNRLNSLKEDPLQGALFVFSNRSHSRLKMLCERI
jgi:hypothetical protein